MRGRPPFQDSLRVRPRNKTPWFANRDTSPVFRGQPEIISRSLVESSHDCGDRNITRSRYRWSRHWGRKGKSDAVGAIRKRNRCIHSPPIDDPVEPRACPGQFVSRAGAAGGGKGCLDEATSARVCLAVGPLEIWMNCSSPAREVLFTATGTRLCVVVLTPSWLSTLSPTPPPTRPGIAPWCDALQRRYPSPFSRAAQRRPRLHSPPQGRGDWFVLFVRGVPYSFQPHAATMPSEQRATL